MWTKIINDRQVFSQCKTIQANNGTWISNPTVEQILAAGWEEFVIPEPSDEDAISVEPTAEQIIIAVKTMLSSNTESLSDEEALAVAALYPLWIDKVGKSVAVGERLWYNNKLYKVIQAHTVQEDWTPDTAVSLFTVVSIEEWPEFIHPTGAHDAYNTGDKITFNGHHYVSKIDSNVYSPEEYPDGWELQD